MKHNNIAKVLGIAEVEDLDEGYHLQPEEASTVDAALGRLSTAEGNAAAGLIELETANATIAADKIKIDALEAAAVTAEEKINGLEEKVKTLGGEASGKGTVLPAAGNEIPTEESADDKPKFDSKDHPANRFADSYKKYDSGIPQK